MLEMLSPQGCSDPGDAQPPGLLRPWGCSAPRDAQTLGMLSPRGCCTALQRALNPVSPPAAPSLVACQAGRARWADSAAGWSPIAPRYLRRAPMRSIAALGAFQILIPRGSRGDSRGASGGGHAPCRAFWPWLPPFQETRRCHLFIAAAVRRRGERGCLTEAFGNRCRHAPVLQTAVQAPRGSHGRLPLSARAAEAGRLRVSPRDICHPGKAEQLRNAFTAPWGVSEGLSASPTRHFQHPGAAI